MARTETKKERLLKEIRELSSDDRIGVVAQAFQALTDEEREDMLDHLAIEEALKTGPGRPLEEYLAEWEAKRKKKTHR